MSLDKSRSNASRIWRETEISDAEAEYYARSYQAFSGSSRQMNAVDTSGVTPMAHPTDRRFCALRADAITEPDQREKFLKIAPATWGRVVPRAQSHQVTAPVPQDPGGAVGAA